MTSITNGYFLLKKICYQYYSKFLGALAQPQFYLFLRIEYLMYWMRKHSRVLALKRIKVW